MPSRTIFTAAAAPQERQHGLDRRQRAREHMPHIRCRRPAYAALCNSEGG
jgi:hypothetical protein